MKSCLLPILLSLLLAGAVYGADETPAPGPSTTALTGTYVLMARPVNTEAFDKIQFHTDGTCILDIDARIGLPGKYHVSQGPDMTSLIIDSGTGGAPIAYMMTRQAHVLLLSRPDDQDSLYYGLVPQDRQQAEFADIAGPYLQQDSNSDNACEITADHRFRVHYRGPADAQNYSEGTNQGKCTFTDGIITYFPEQPYEGISYQYLRDIVVKHDAKGLWIVDPYDDKVICETPVKTLDLPPPPLNPKAQ